MRRALPSGLRFEARPRSVPTAHGRPLGSRVSSRRAHPIESLDPAVGVIGDEGSVSSVRFPLASYWYGLLGSRFSARPRRNFRGPARDQVGHGKLQSAPHRGHRPKKPPHAIGENVRRSDALLFGRHDSWAADRHAALAGRAEIPASPAARGKALLPPATPAVEPVGARFGRTALIPPPMASLWLASMPMEKFPTTIFMVTLAA